MVRPPYLMLVGLGDSVDAAGVVDAVPAAWKVGIAQSMDHEVYGRAFPRGGERAASRAFLDLRGG